MLGVTRAFPVELTKPFYVLEAYSQTSEHLVIFVGSFYAREIEHRVQEHGRMAIRQHETIAIGPDRVVGVVAQKSLPQRVHHRCERHRRAWVTRIGLLHRIHRKGANGVYAKVIERGRVLRCPPRQVQMRVSARNSSSGHPRLLAIWKSETAHPFGTRTGPCG